MLGPQQARCFRRGGARVLDGLRLVENRVVELDAGHVRRVAAQRAVRGEHDVGIGRIDGLDAPRRRTHIEQSQLRREPFRFTLPVEHERPRHDDDRRTVPIDAPLVEHREHLHCLAKSHVVGKAATKLELPQEVEPAQPFALVITQRSAKRRWRIDWSDRSERGELGPCTLERAVDIDTRHRREQRIEQYELRAAKA